MEADKRLFNVKVYVNGKSREIREKAFSLGWKWSLSSTDVKFEDAPFLFFSGEGSISYGTNMENFSRSAYTEVTAEYILGLDAEYPEGEGLVPAKPVLVRNTLSETWKLDIFARLVRSGVSYCAECLGGRIFVYCISFLGNESLLGTTKDIDEL